MYYSDKTKWDDRAFQAIFDHLEPCSTELLDVECKWGTYRNAWAECDSPRLYGWFLGRMAEKNDYYRRAMLSVISQFLYEYSLGLDDEIFSLTECLDSVVEGKDDYIPECRKIGHRIVRRIDDRYTANHPEDNSDHLFEALELIDTALELLKVRRSLWNMECVFDSLSYERDGLEVCHIIRKMVERPTIGEIKEIKPSR